MVFVNGEVREVIEINESTQPRKQITLHCFRIIEITK